MKLFQIYHFPRSVRLSLMGLVLVSTVPILVFAVSTAMKFVEQTKSNVELRLQNITGGLQVALERELNSHIQAMKVMATDPLFQDKNRPAISARLSKAAVANPSWLNLVVIEPQSHTIIASGMSAQGSAVTSTQPDAVDTVVKTRMPLVVGVVGAGSFVKEPMIIIMVPVFVGDGLRQVLAVAINPKAFSGILLEDLHVLPSWTGAVIDSNMTLAGRSRSPEKFVGKRATPSLASHISQSTQGIFSATNQEGAKVYTVFTRSAHTGWTVVIGIPAEEIDGPLTSILVKLGLLAGALILFALALAWLVGREIVRRQDTLHQERQRFKIFLDSASDAISIVDAQGQLTEYSHSFAELLGYGVEDMARLKMEAWCSETTVDEIFRSAAESFNTPVLSQQRYRRRDGSLVDVEVASHMLMIDDQRSLYCAARDVTERNRMDAELAAALELSEASAIAKSVFLANMNHEIRTPLNGIMGMAYLLGSPELAAEQRIEYAETMMDSGERLLRLLGDILELAAIEDRRVKLMTKEINLVHVMRDVMELFSEKSRAKGLSVAHRLELESMRYLGDSYRLTQMLSHLLSNAINFSAQGPILIEARERSRTESHAMLEFSVTDKGIGIATEKHALLFQNFSQIDNLMSRKQDGAGVGLSMVRHLAELMDGAVGFESQLGQGSRFWFCIKVQLVAARGRKSPYAFESTDAAAP